MSDITVRKIAFEWPADLAVLPRPDDVVGSCELVGFSLTLPYLEPYLIRTMRAASKVTSDPILLADMKAFSGQEAFHHKNHTRINEVLRSNLSTDTAAVIRGIESELSDDYQRFTAEKSLKFNLAYAEGFEAMTLGLALMLVERGFDDVDVNWRELIEWHLAEEIEHRTVTFDAYDKIFGRYLYRARMGSWAQWHFLRYIFRFAEAVYRDVAPDATDDPWGSMWGIVKTQWSSGLLPRMLRALPPWYDPAKVEMPASVRSLLDKYDDVAAA